MCLSITESDNQMVEIVHRELEFPNPIRHGTRYKENYTEHYCEISCSNKWAGPYWDTLGLVCNKTGNEM